MSELNREQIIKALECCSDETTEFCTGCPFIGTYCKQSTLKKLALALIKELTEENEKLGIENFDLICELSRIKEDTVRKMQEMLCEGRVSNDPVVIAVNVVAKEMLNEKGDTE